MELNSKKLIDALSDMLKSKQFTQEEITQKSTVHNLGRIVTGSIAVTDSSWLKLYRAYPDYIPFPEYLDGEHLYVASPSVGKGVKHGNKIAVFSSPGVELSELELSLIKALRKLGDHEDVVIIVECK